MLGKYKKSVDSHFKNVNIPGKVVHLDLCGKILYSINGMEISALSWINSLGTLTLLQFPKDPKPWNSLKNTKNLPSFKYYPKGVQSPQTDGQGE